MKTLTRQELLEKVLKRIRLVASVNCHEVIALGDCFTLNLLRYSRDGRITHCVLMGVRGFERQELHVFEGTECNAISKALRLRAEELDSLRVLEDECFRSLAMEKL
jgi:hypothetical protein